MGLNGENSRGGRAVEAQMDIRKESRAGRNKRIRKGTVEVRIGGKEGFYGGISRVEG